MMKNNIYGWAMGAVLTAGSVAGSTLAAGAQAAGPATPAAKQWLMLLDPDKDATVSKEEYVSYIQKEFGTLDVDHDGTLDAKELNEVRGLPAVGAEGVAKPGKHDGKQLLLAMDTDKDGTVSKDELTAYAGMVFDRLDHDHDGTLDAVELNQLGPAPKG
jgi:EF-hand domain pair